MAEAQAPVMADPPVPIGLREAEAAVFLGLPRRTFGRAVREGRLPAPVRFGRRKVWDRRALERALGELGGDGADPIMARIRAWSP